MKAPPVDVIKIVAQSIVVNLDRLAVGDLGTIKIEGVDPNNVAEICAIAAVAAGCQIVERVAGQANALIWLRAIADEWEIAQHGELTPQTKQ